MNMETMKFLHEEKIKGIQRASKSAKRATSFTCAQTLMFIEQAIESLRIAEVSENAEYEHLVELWRETKEVSQ